MSENIPTRADAWELLNRYNQSDALLKHALAVEAVMRDSARKRGGDEELWGILGLLHDLDYEQFPEEHCHKTKEILEENDYPPDFIRAVLSHGWEICTDVEPQTEMEKVLYAVDELTGLIAAVALVRPSKSIMDVKVKSVKKKWKVSSFAAGANREVIQKGADMLGLELSDLIAEVLAGMQQAAEAIGLQGVNPEEPAG